MLMRFLQKEAPHHLLLLGLVQGRDIDLRIAQVAGQPFWAPGGFEPDFVVSTDIAARSLFFPAAEPYRERVDLAIDHHPSHEGFAKASCVDASRAACGEIIYDICLALGEITPQEDALPVVEELHVAQQVRLQGKALGALGAEVALVEGGGVDAGLHQGGGNQAWPCS